MGNVIILGAGLAGLSAAYHLESQGFSEYEVFEREPVVGGLCSSMVIEGFTFDHAIHILYSGNKYAEDLIKNRLLKNNFHSLYRRSYVYYKGKYTEYPFQVHLYGQGIDVIKECVLGLIKARYENKSTPSNFEEWIHSIFGYGIARHFMLPYNRKQWAANLQEMSYDWIAERVPVPEIEEVLDGALRPPQKAFGPNSYFWYPLKGGMNSLPNAFLDYIGNVSLNSEVSKISLKNKEIEVKGRKVKYDKIISTIPLPKIISLIAEDKPAHIEEAAERLRCNSVYTVNLAIDRPDIADFHWVYFPEPEYIFQRISFPMNLSPFMAPAAKSSISAEISVSKSKPLKIKETELVDAVVDDLTKCEVISKQDKIIFGDVKRLYPAYVIYTIGGRHTRDSIHQFLHSKDIYPCGRFGEWEYLNMDHAILSGKKAADEVLSKQT